MSRPLRIEYPDAWYHVMNRGRRSEEIYFTDSDREEFLNSVPRKRGDESIAVVSMQYSLFINL